MGRRPRDRSASQSCVDKWAARFVQNGTPVLTRPERAAVDDCKTRLLDYEAFLTGRLDFDSRARLLGVALAELDVVTTGGERCDDIGEWYGQPAAGHAELCGG